MWKASWCSLHLCLIPNSQLVSFYRCVSNTVDYWSDRPQENHGPVLLCLLILQPAAVSLCWKVSKTQQNTSAESVFFLNCGRRQCLFLGAEEQGNAKIGSGDLSEFKPFQARYRNCVMRSLSKLQIFSWYVGLCISNRQAAVWLPSCVCANFFG